MKKRYLIAALVVLSVVSLFIGVKNISPLDLFHLSDDQAHVLWISRFPRLISILIAGVSMGTSVSIPQAG